MPGVGSLILTHDLYQRVSRKRWGGRQMTMTRRGNEETRQSEYRSQGA